MSEKVKLSGNVKVSKESEGKKFAKLFFTGNLVEAMKYGFENVLVPYAKDAICKTSTNIISCWVNGDRPSSAQTTSSSRVSYWSGINNQRTTPYVSGTTTSVAKSSNAFNFDVFEYELRGDAELVLLKMREILNTYHVVTVADLYDINDRKTVYTTTKYGWTNLDNASVRPLPNGRYMIDLPRVSPIE